MERREKEESAGMERREKEVSAGMERRGKDVSAGIKRREKEDGLFRKPNITVGSEGGNAKGASSDEGNHRTFYQRVGKASMPQGIVSPSIALHKLIGSQVWKILESLRFAVEFVFVVFHLPALVYSLYLYNMCVVVLYV